MCLKLVLVWFIFVSLAFFSFGLSRVLSSHFLVLSQKAARTTTKNSFTPDWAPPFFGCGCLFVKGRRGLFCCCSRQKICSGRTRTWHCLWQIRKSKSAYHSLYLFFCFLISLLAHRERYRWTLFILYHNRGKGPLLWYHRLVHFMGGVSERVLILWEISTLIITFPFALLSYFLGRYFPCLL